MVQDSKLSGHGSKVLEVDLPHGNYRLSWAAEGDADDGHTFYIDLEQEESEALVIEYVEQSGSGEVFARLPGGRHIFSVKASHLNWTIEFTPL